MPWLTKHSEGQGHVYKYVTMAGPAWHAVYASQNKCSQHCSWFFQLLILEHQLICWLLWFSRPSLRFHLVEIMCPMQLIYVPLVQTSEDSLAMVKVEALKLRQCLSIKILGSCICLRWSTGNNSMATVLWVCFFGFVFFWSLGALCPLSSFRQDGGRNVTEGHVAGHLET